MCETLSSCSAAKKASSTADVVACASRARLIACCCTASNCKGVRKGIGYIAFHVGLGMFAGSPSPPSQPMPSTLNPNGPSLDLDHPFTHPLYKSSHSDLQLACRSWLHLLGTLHDM